MTGPTLRNARFVVAKCNLVALFSDNPGESEQMEWLVDYAKRYGGEIWVCGSQYGPIKASMKGDSYLEGWLKELLRDGTQLAGTATFGSETADMLFLAGLLYSTDGGRPLVVIHDPPDKFLAMPDHTHVFQKLNAMGISFISWQTMTLASALTIIRQDPDFAAYTESLRSG